MVLLQDRHSAHSLRLQEPSFAWLLCTVVWLLLLVIMVPNMALPTKQVQVRVTPATLFQGTVEPNGTESESDGDPMIQIP